MRRAKISAVILFVLAAAMRPGGALAGDIYIRAKDYISSYNIMLMPIGVEADSLLIGLDYPGEWVEYHFYMDGFGYYTTHLLVMGAYSVPYSVKMTLTGDDSHNSTQIFFDFVGTGFS